MLRDWKSRRDSVRKAQACLPQRNIQNGISLMQTADSVANGMIPIFSRMKDLSVQAVDGASTDADKSNFRGLNYVAQTAEGSKGQMLAQASTSMLKQTTSLAKLTLSLI